MPSICGACLKGRRLVTSLGPILEKRLAVSEESYFLESRIFRKSERSFIQHSKDSQVKFISPSFNEFCRKNKYFIVLVAMELKL